MLFVLALMRDCQKVFLLMDTVKVSGLTASLLAVKKAT